MMASSKTYWDEPLRESFQVSVLSVEKTENGFHVRIDQDVIRPEGGGQAGDRGTLGDVRILNTVKENNQILLETDKPVEIGETFELRIDMNWRRSSTRNHTAEHIFVSQLKQLNEDIKLGYIWIDADQGTVEIEGEISDEILFQAENRVQEIIFADREVCSSIISSSSLSDSVRAREGLEAKHETLRIVTIEGIDDSACSGIHVLSTGDIGFFKITDIKREHCTTRMQFMTHLKATRQVQSIYNLLLQRKHSFPYEMEQIGAVLDKAKRSAEDKYEMTRVISSFLSASDEFDEIGDKKFFYHYLPGFEIKDLKNTVKEFPQNKDTAVLLFAPGQKSTFIFWTHELPQDASFYVKEVTERLGGRGGGSRNSFTGGFTEVRNPSALYQELVRGITERLASKDQNHVTS